MKLLMLSFLINIAYSTEIVVISDLNGSYGSTKYSSYVDKAVEKIIEINPDVILTTGDMVAGQKAGLNYKAMWASFHSRVTTQFEKAGIPILVTPGNHDGSASKKFKAERAEFVSQWNKHKAQVNYIDDSNYPIYYAFSVNEILFISIDATLTGLLSRTQKDWLEKILKENTKFKYKITFGHIPIMPVAQKRENDYLNDNELDKLLSIYKVDAYLSGHHHAYYPGKKDHMLHISQACLGGGPRKLIGDNKRSDKSFTTISIKNGKISIDAIKPMTGESINKSLLPVSIKTPKGLLLREDLVFN